MRAQASTKDGGCPEWGGGQHLVERSLEQALVRRSRCGPRSGRERRRSSPNPHARRASSTLCSNAAARPPSIASPSSAAPSRRLAAPARHQQSRGGVQQHHVAATVRTALRARPGPGVHSRRIASAHSLRGAPAEAGVLGSHLVARDRSSPTSATAVSPARVNSSRPAPWTTRARRAQPGESSGRRSPELRPRHAHHLGHGLARGWSAGRAG